MPNGVSAEVVFSVDEKCVYLVTCDNDASRDVKCCIEREFYEERSQHKVPKHAHSDETLIFPVALYGHKAHESRGETGRVQRIRNVLTACTRNYTLGAELQQTREQDVI